MAEDGSLDMPKGTANFQECYTAGDRHLHLILPVNTMAKRTQLNFTPTKQLRELLEAQAELEGSPVSDVIRRRLLMGFGLLPVERVILNPQGEKEAGKGGQK